MEIKCIKSTLLNTNNYIFSDKEVNILIEASVKLDTLKNIVKKIDAILITHMHWDHYENLEDIVSYYNCPVYFRKEGYDKLLLSNKKLFKFDKSFSCEIDNQYINYVKDNEDFYIKDIKIKPIFTSGHTNCSCSYLINNNLFTGDILFYHNVGRTDLPTGNQLDLNISLNKILNLNEDIVVYPGHGEKTDIKSEKVFFNNYLNN